MTAETHTVNLDGRVLERGFWLNVWEVTGPNASEHVYVGRTGDSSSPNAQSPFVRMGQHLGGLKNSSMLRNHLERRHVAPEDCKFRLVAHGPVLAEVGDRDMAAHCERRDLIAALEKRLARTWTLSATTESDQSSCVVRVICWTARRLDARPTARRPDARGAHHDDRRRPITRHGCLRAPSWTAHRGFRPSRTPGHALLGRSHP